VAAAAVRFSTLNLLKICSTCLQIVRVDAPCLDCGDPVTLEMRDGRITRVEPAGVIGHLNFGFGPSRGRPAFL